MMPVEHPSFLELDQIAVGRVPSATTSSHLAACVACQQHLATVQQAPAIPGWLASVTHAAPRRRPQLRSRWFAGFGLALAATVAILLFVLVRPRTAELTSQTTAKGLPSVAVHVLRRDQVSLWDGHSPIHPGDRLRLEVMPEGFHYLRVLTATSEGHYRSLYDTELATSSASVLLATAWQVDEAPGPETLIIAMSDEPIPEIVPEARIAAAIHDQLAAKSSETPDSRLHLEPHAPISRDLWVTSLSLPKTLPPDGRP